MATISQALTIALEHHRAGRGGAGRAAGRHDLAIDALRRPARVRPSDPTARIGILSALLAAGTANSEVSSACRSVLVLDPARHDSDARALVPFDPWRAPVLLRPSGGTSGSDQR